MKMMLKFIRKKHYPGNSVVTDYIINRSRIRHTLVTSWLN